MFGFLKKTVKWYKGLSGRRALVVAGVALFLLISVVRAGMKKQMAPLDDLKTVPAVAVDVRIDTIWQRVRINGDIRGQNQTDIYPDVPGKIQNIFVKEGDYVRQGQTVATIDRSQVGMVYMPAPVTAPIAGVIGRIYVERGMTVAPSMPIMLIADTRVAEGVLQVPEKYVPYFRVGQSADIRLEGYPDTVFSGTVYKVASVIDPATRTLEVRLRFTNTGNKVLPGNYADFSVNVQVLSNQVVVPFDAVIDSIERKEVFVLEESALSDASAGADNPARGAEPPGRSLERIFTARTRTIRTGIQDGTNVQVIAGLQPGERVLTLGKENAIDGARIRLVRFGEKGGSGGETNAAAQLPSGWIRRAMERAGMLAPDTNAAFEAATNEKPSVLDTEAVK